MALITASPRSLFYPAFGLSRLRGQHGHRWADLVDWISQLPESDPQVMAFTLTMRRLRRSLRLDHAICRDPFCAICSAAVVAGFDGGEDALLALYQRNLDEIARTLAARRVRTVAVLVDRVAA